MTQMPEHQQDLPAAVPSETPGAPVAVGWTHRIERAAALDRVAGVVSRVSAPLGKPPVRDVLLGTATGHALHPALTDLPIGLWTSASLLDLVGGRAAAPAAQRLVGAGILCAVPTALTGLAEWRQTTVPESRVGVVHANLNSVALSLYAGSWMARRSGRHRAGVAMSLAATGVATVAGFLGGHLATARKTGSRHPAYEKDGVGPELRRPA